MKPRLYLTRHAKERMKERGVSLEEVYEALENPVQHVYDQLNDVYLVLGSNGIAVVYAARGLTYEIITVMTKREYEALVRRLGRRRYRVIE